MATKRTQSNAAKVFTVMSMALPYIMKSMRKQAHRRTIGMLSAGAVATFAIGYGIRRYMLHHSH